MDRICILSHHNCPTIEYYTDDHEDKKENYYIKSALGGLSVGFGPPLVINFKLYMTSGNEVSLKLIGIML